MHPITSIRTGWIGKHHKACCTSSSPPTAKSGKLHVARDTSTHGSGSYAIETRSRSSPLSSAANSASRSAISWTRDAPPADATPASPRRHAARWSAWLLACACTQHRQGAISTITGSTHQDIIAWNRFGNRRGKQKEQCSGWHFPPIEHSQGAGGSVGECGILTGSHS